MVFLSVQTDAQGGASAQLSPEEVYYLTESAIGSTYVLTIENEYGSVIGYLHERNDDVEKYTGRIAACNTCGESRAISALDRSCNVPACPGTIIALTYSEPSGDPYYDR